MNKKCYIPGDQINVKNPEIVTDWEHELGTGEPDGIGLNGVLVWSDWFFSVTKKIFRQNGGNTNGRRWDRYYRAVITDKKYMNHAVYC